MTDQLMTASLLHLEKMHDLADKHVGFLLTMAGTSELVSSARNDVDAAKMHIIRLRSHLALEGDTTPPAAKPAPEPTAEHSLTKAIGLDVVLKEITEMATAAQPFVDALVKWGKRKL